MQRPDQRAARDFDNEIFASGPIHAFAEARLAVLGDEAGLIILPDEVVEVVVGLKYDIAAPATVAAAGPAFRAVFLTLKGDAAFAAVTGAGVDFYFVNEHRGKKRKWSREADISLSAGSRSRTL